MNNHIQDKDKELADIMKALGHPVRLTIIRKIVEKSKCPCNCNPCSCGDKCERENCKCGCRCGELVDLFPMAQSTVSQHLKELKNAGIIKMNGRKGDYTINHHRLKEGLNLLHILLDHDNSMDYENKYKNSNHLDKENDNSINPDICYCH